MVHIHALTVGSLGTNTYLVFEPNSPTCLVIDPGAEGARILEKATQLGRSIEAILLTHGHFDHVEAVQELVQRTACAVWIHPGDHNPALPQHPMSGMLYPLAGTPADAFRFCNDGDTVYAAGLGLQVLHMPGHTPGSVCFVCEEALFSGDVLFAGSCGRTDLPGGNHTTMRKTLRRLSALTQDYQVYPGHGNSTTLAQEKRYNPYMR